MACAGKTLYLLPIKSHAQLVSFKYNLCPKRTQLLQAICVIKKNKKTPNNMLFDILFHDVISKAFLYKFNIFG